MDRADIEKLAAFCRDRAGDRVRAVGRVSDGEVHPEYMREDLQRRYTGSELQGLERAATEAGGAVADMNTYNTSLGQSHAGLFVFEDALMLLVPDRSGDAAYVSLDRSVSEGLAAFVKECEHELFSRNARPRRGVSHGEDAEPADDAE